MENIREALYEIYEKIEHVITPSLKYSQDVYEEVLREYVHSEFVWLDLGCGHQLLSPWRFTEEKNFISNCKMVLGIDYDLHSLKKHATIPYKIRGEASNLPFKKNSFDLITSNMVVEHFDNPDEQFREIYSLLKPGGFFIFHTPNVFGYPTATARLLPEKWKNTLIYLLEGRKEEDVFATYYKINSESRIRALAQETGFTVQKIRMIVTTAESAAIFPLAILELLWIKALMTKPLKSLRTNIIAILQKERLMH